MQYRQIRQRQPTSAARRPSPTWPGGRFPGWLSTSSRNWLRNPWAGLQLSTAIYAYIRRRELTCPAECGRRLDLLPATEEPLLLHRFRWTGYVPRSNATAANERGLDGVCVP